ncbi:MAG: OmpA family protein [Bacteroidetes bacterium]|nr:OmpA family protein [Bacteroidota bacterium]
MKKTLTTFALCGCLAIGSAFAQTTKQDVNHISFGLKWGTNYLLLSDRSQIATEVNPSFGAFFEYTVNPLWSAGVEYLYMNNCQFVRRVGHLEAAIQGITYYNTINVTNLVAKYRSPGWQKFNVYGSLGGGVGLYSYYYKRASGNSDKETGAQPMVTGGLAMEYNITKSIALGVESQYRYTPDVKFVPTAGTANLCGFNLTGRIKLGGDKNVRNIALTDYEPNPCAQAPATDNSAALNQQKQRINQLENTVAQNDDDIQTLQQQLKDLQNKLAQKPAAPVQEATPAPAQTVTTSIDNIDFATNSSKITKPNAELDDLAAQLKANPTWKAEISGHTDNTGTDAINNPLSKKRAEAVKTYLINKGVAASRITTQGFGSKKPIASNDTPEGRKQNRRVEIKVIK